jgi:hypothetical protein
MKHTFLFAMGLAFGSLQVLAGDGNADNNTKGKGDFWKKPYDYGYYNMMTGYVTGSGPVREGNYGAFWGQGRISFVNAMINRLPKHRFQIRDIVDAQAGFGIGKGVSDKKVSSIYLNAAVAGGLKFKYDISRKVDFGMNVTYRYSIDNFTFFGAAIGGFIRYDRFLAEITSGGNGDVSPTDHQAKYTNINLKYFLHPDNPHTWSINLSYWGIDRRNNQIDNPWEHGTQIMIGVGAQLF